MDIKIEWSPEALEDLEAIADYISRDSEFYARSVATKIVAMCSGLSEAPYIGRIVPEFGDATIRERIVYSYRLVYRVEEKKILIIAIIHGKRLLENISDRLTPPE